MSTTVHSGGADGAAFGTTFPHLFLMTFSNLVPDPLPPESVYVPRVFGFRIHKSSTPSQQQRQQQQRFLPSPTTATTTNTSNTQSTLHTTATTVALQPDQQQPEHLTTEAQSTIMDRNEDNNKHPLVHDESIKTDDRKIVAVKGLDVEDPDDNDANNDDFPHASIRTSGSAILHDSETATAVPSLLAVDDTSGVVNHNELTATNVKRNRDTNGIPETSASLIKRRKRAPTSGNNS
jgi:hypothetical protein